MEELPSGLSFPRSAQLAFPAHPHSDKGCGAMPGRAFSLHFANEVIWKAARGAKHLSLWMAPGSTSEKERYSAGSGPRGKAGNGTIGNRRLG